MSDFNDDDSSKAKGSSPIAKQRNFRDRKKVNYKPVPITSRESEPESEESLSYATIDEDELDDLYAPSPHQRQLTEQIKEQIRTYAVVHQWNSKKIHQILERNFGDKACCYHTVLRYAKQFREGTNTTKPKDAKVKKETKKKKTATATAAPKAKKTKAGGGQMQPNATVPDNVSPYFANDLDQYESMNEDEAETAYLVARANDHYD